MRTDTNLIDKSGWSLGPWMDEPDRVQWQHQGYSCLIVRSEVSGALCGYVGVAEGHPWYGKGYEDLPDVEVHGGLTYSRFRADDPQNSEQEKPLWWLGFDCAHSGDYLPGMAHVTVLLAEWTMIDSVYMDLDAVRWETEDLVMQAMRAAQVAKGGAMSQFDKVIRCFNCGRIVLPDSDEVGRLSIDGLDPAERIDPDEDTLFFHKKCTNKAIR